MLADIILAVIFTIAAAIILFKCENKISNWKK